MLKRPHLLQEIKASQANAANRQTLLDADSSIKKEELEKKERQIKNELKKYVIRYMKSIKELLADEYDERIRKIINKRDKDGNTPLHYAVSNWPQKVVKDMLKLGADLSIANKAQRIPLEMLPKNTINEFLDDHCMASDGFDALDDDEYYYGSNEEIKKEKGNEDDDRFYKELLDDYDPKFMTNIVQSPITFKYDLLSPTPYSKRDPPSTGGKEETNFSTPSEMSVLNAICNSKEHRYLVTHPVIVSFIWLKWKLVSKCYNRNMRMNVLLTYCLSWYIFYRFGGLEWNNKCEMASSALFSNDLNFTTFCKLHEEEYLNLTNTEKYGELENMSLAERWKYYVYEIYADEGICLYKNVFYIVFVIISLILIVLMVKDTIRDFFPRNAWKNGNIAQNFQCMSCIIPFGIDTINLVLLISTLMFSVSSLWVLISVIFLIRILSEVSQLITAPTTYFKKPSNWADIGILALIFAVLYVPNEYISDPIGFSLHSTIEKVCNIPGNGSDVNQEHNTTNDFISPSDVSVKRFLSSFLIVLSWTRFAFDIFKHPGKSTETYNKYAMMYGKVATSFFKLFVCYCLFIVAFSIGFYIGFHNDIGDRNLNVDSLSPYVFFDSQFESFVKVIAMFVGEVDFNNIPVGISYARRHGNVSVVLGYLFFLLFIFMITIVLMNLLNGLAVTDITEIIRESEALHQISLIEILSDFEGTAFTYKKGLRFLAKTCSCLKHFLLNYLDISKELLLFSTNNTSDIRREKLFKRQMTFPLSYASNEDLKSDDRGFLKRLLTKYFRPDENKGSEHILSDARAILIKAKKSRMDQRARKKEQVKEMEGALEKAEIEREKTVTLLKQTVIDRLIPVVETNVPFSKF